MRPLVQFTKLYATQHALRHLNLRALLRSYSSPHHFRFKHACPHLPGRIIQIRFHGPLGFVYQPAFITREEESALLDIIRALPLQEAKFQQYTARRRTVRYGTEYDPRAKAPDQAPGIPEFLFPLRDKVARWIALPAESFVHGLVTKYRLGTPLGWHRDSPEYEAIAGVSLGAACRMRLRPYQPDERHKKEDVISLELEPRSAYQIRDKARWGWQHSIAATKQLRYSIMFRTARR